MTSQPTNADIPTNEENIAAWSAIPSDQITALDPEGDFTKKYMLNSAVLALLGDLQGAKVLDAGAGQGYFSRMMARAGASVTSLEPAEALHRHSVAMEAKEPLGVRCVQGDLTVVALEPTFDLVVCNMAFQSIQDWEAALAACAQGLRPGGSLVFSVDHPCFETAERRDLGSDPHVVLRDYLSERPLPRPVATDFHRTLTTYLNGILGAGLAITGVVEPALSEAGVAAPGAPDSALLLQRVPSLLVLRARKPD